MASPFVNWSLRDAREALYAVQHPLAETNHMFFTGDHWQGSDGWVGPMPKESEENYSLTMTAIERAFTSRNIIAEIVERHRDGVIAREPSWAFTPRRVAGPTAQELQARESALITEVEANLTAWWDRRQAHLVFHRALDQALYTSQSAIRLFVPKGKLVGGVLPRAKTLEEALSYLYIESPLYSTCAVVEDPDTKTLCGLFYSVDERGQESMELTYLDPDTGNTMIRVISGGTDTEFRFDFGGRLPIIGVARELLITQQIQEAQRAYNLANSMIPRNVVTGGFLERVLLNCQLPGHWVKDNNGTNTKFVPEPLLLGAGTTNAFQGTTYTGEDGVTRVMNPDVKYREPVDVKPAVNAKMSHYKDMLEEADQVHILIAGEAEASGKAREQARADYVNSLRNSQPIMEGAIRSVLETALAMAEQFMLAPGRWTTSLRATVTCRLDQGPISNEERATNQNLVKDGQLSRVTAMQRDGIPDVDAELAIIEASPEYQLELLKKRVEVAGMIVKGMSLDAVTAAELVGLPKEQIALVKKGVEQNSVDEEDDPTQKIQVA
jgi:hypothetical protein